MRTLRTRGAGVAMALLALLGGCSDAADHYSSPDGRREVVITSGRATIDALWSVSIRTRGFMGERRDLGCFTDDDPDAEVPTGVTWADDDTFVIATSIDDQSAPGPDVRVHLTPGGPDDVTQTGDDFLVPCPYS